MACLLFKSESMLPARVGNQESQAVEALAQRDEHTRSTVGVGRLGAVVAGATPLLTSAARWLCINLCAPSNQCSLCSSRPRLPRPERTACRAKTGWQSALRCLEVSSCGALAVRYRNRQSHTHNLKARWIRRRNASSCSSCCCRICNSLEARCVLCLRNNGVGGVAAAGVAAAAAEATAAGWRRRRRRRLRRREKPRRNRSADWTPATISGRC